MRKLVEGIQLRLQRFVDQRSHVALVLSSPAADSLPILKMIEGIEESSSSHLFWTFTDDFVDPASYVDAIVKSFAARHDLVRQAMAKEGLALWPEIPAAIRAGGQDPVARIRGLAAFSRDLLPRDGGAAAVWTFYPLSIASPGPYARWIAGVLEHEFPFPWCHHLRFIVRQDPADPAVARALAGKPRIDAYQPDLGAEAIQRSLEEAAVDESLSLDERIGCLLVAAGHDMAFQRHAEALQKYTLLLGYHGALANTGLAAVALNGMGEVYERMGDLERANRSYEAALVPASHGAHPPVPVFLNVVLNLARLRAEQQRWADSEAYYDVGQQLATVARDPTTKVRCLEGRGVCQRQQRKHAEAVESWQGGLAIAAQLEQVDLCADLLERLRGHYADVGDRRREREVSAQLAPLRDGR
jgi:tetratricopeptide (TPR) repeat protein